MGLIDIGSAVIDRGTIDSTRTILLRDNPANDTGTLTQFEVWFGSEGSPALGVKLGTFSGSGTEYTSRDVEVIGSVTKGSKQTFSGLDCDVVIGDFVGLYFSQGGIEIDSTGGVGYYYKLGDQFGAGQQTYGLRSTRSLSLYGTGETLVTAPTVTTQAVTNIGFD